MKKAFSLIESLVYLLCVVLIINLFVGVFSSFQSRVNSYVYDSQNYISQIKAFFSMVEELELIEVGDIKKISKKCIIWSGEIKDRSWEFEYPRLLFVSGHYNESKDVWRKRKASLAAKNLQDVSFKAFYIDSKLRGINISMKNIQDDKLINYFVALRSGIL